MALQTLTMRCCDDLLILKGVDQHEKVGKASLNSLCGGKICMDRVGMTMLDMEDVHSPSGSRDVLCIGVIQQRSAQFIQ